MLKIAEEKLPQLLELMAGERKVFVPVHAGGQPGYKIWTKDTEAALDILNTTKSPKELFFPQSETLYTCYREGKKLTLDAAETEKEDFVLFGIRPCDVKGLEVLDRVFLADPVDTFYAARRAHGILISMACHQPEETCFCQTFGVDPSAPSADVAVWKVDGWLYWEAQTEKGETLTAQVRGLFTEDDEKAVQEEKKAILEICEKLPFRKLSLETVGAGTTKQNFPSPKWEELSSACLGCGTCTYVCPTCQCYDIRDYDTGHGIQRYRCWDSCMYSDFTMMAHGNPRTSQVERFRQRFMHKLVYYPDNHDGMYSCVGCGRCVSKCPTSLNIVKVIKSLGVSES